MFDFKIGENDEQNLSKTNFSIVVQGSIGLAGMLLYSSADHPPFPLFLAIFVLAMLGSVVLFVLAYHFHSLEYLILSLSMAPPVIVSYLLFTYLPLKIANIIVFAVVIVLLSLSVGYEVHAYFQKKARKKVRKPDTK